MLNYAPRNQTRCVLTAFATLKFTQFGTTNMLNFNPTIRVDIRLMLRFLKRSWLLHEVCVNEH